jgi:hypothetical protein
MPKDSILQGLRNTWQNYVGKNKISKIFFCDGYKLQLPRCPIYHRLWAHHVHKVYWEQNDIFLSSLSIILETYIHINDQLKKLSPRISSLPIKKLTLLDVLCEYIEIVLVIHLLATKVALTS